MKFKSIKDELKFYREGMKYNDLYIKVLSGLYNGSILLVSNISLNYYSISSFNISMRKSLSFKYYEVAFLPTDEYIQSIKISIPKDKKELLDQELIVDDLVAYVSPIHSKRTSLQIGRVISTNNPKTIAIKSIPLVGNEKSVELNQIWRENVIKLSSDQIKKLLENKLSY